MDRGASSHLLSWMIWPVCAVLAFGALTLPRQPYTGVMLRGDWVARVEPRSPGEAAGVHPGDRLLRDPSLSTGPENPLAGAQPGVPFPLLREHGGNIDDVTIVPAPLPAEERRVMAMLLAVASGFMVLGGWLWSERQDRMTRAFFLMCLSFACLIAPFPRFRSPGAMLAYETLYSGITLFLPAMLIHFFALFPDSTRTRGALTRITRIAYGVSAGLFAIELLLAVAPLLARHALDPVQELLQSMAALWFGLGTLVAITLFVRSYLMARGEDSRRRLRVALAGTVLGFLPLTALVLLRNLFPGLSFPAERGAVMLTLLVPASFAWAAGVYRVFEVRMALRAAVVLGLLLVMSAVVFSLGEWLAGAWRPDLGHGIAGGALAFVVFISAVAGPAARALRNLGERMVPDARERSPFAILEMRAELRHASVDELYARACESVAEWLRLDGCAALDLAGGPPRLAARAGRTRAPGLDSASATQLRALSIHPVPLDGAPLEPDARLALEAAGVSWIAPMGVQPVRAVLLLGHRVGGPWVSVPEIQELERFAAHVEVLIENATLRKAATAHGAIRREMTRAHSIQLHLLPRRAPAYPTLDCAAAALSSEPVGGDYYDFVKVPGRVLTLAVGDAAGKGVPGALMGVWAQACFRNEARRGAGPGQVLTALNHELVSMDQPEAFVALACMRVEVRRARLTYANAGLTPPLLRRANGTVEILSESGVLLGVTPEARYADTPVDLDAGDIVVLYTDGLTEARHGDDMFGPERLAEVLRLNAELRASEIANVLLGAVQSFTDQPLDDLTVVVLKQIGAPVRAEERFSEKDLKFSPA